MREAESLREGINENRSCRHSTEAEGNGRAGEKNRLIADSGHQRPFNYGGDTGRLY
jgi:hypothetical protein